MVCESKNNFYSITTLISANAQSDNLSQKTSKNPSINIINEIGWRIDITNERGSSSDTTNKSGWRIYTKKNWIKYWYNNLKCLKDRYNKWK